MTKYEKSYSQIYNYTGTLSNYYSSTLAVDEEVDYYDDVWHEIDNSDYFAVVENPNKNFPALRLELATDNVRGIMFGKSMGGTKDVESYVSANKVNYSSWTIVFACDPTDFSYIIAGVASTYGSNVAMPMAYYRMLHGISMLGCEETVSGIYDTLRRSHLAPDVTLITETGLPTLSSTASLFTCKIVLLWTKTASSYVSPVIVSFIITDDEGNEIKTTLMSNNYGDGVNCSRWYYMVPYICVRPVAATATYFYIHAIRGEMKCL